jgi:hypothetical protein
MGLKVTGVDVRFNNGNIIWRSCEAVASGDRLVIRSNKNQVNVTLAIEITGYSADKPKIAGFSANPLTGFIAKDAGTRYWPITIERRNRCSLTFLINDYEVGCAWLGAVRDLVMGE